MRNISIVNIKRRWGQRHLLFIFIILISTAPLKTRSAENTSTSGATTGSLSEIMNNSRWRLPWKWPKGPYRTLNGLNVSALLGSYEMSGTVTQSDYVANMQSLDNSGIYGIKIGYNKLRGENFGVGYISRLNYARKSSGISWEPYSFFKAEFGLAAGVVDTFYAHAGFNLMKFDSSNNSRMTPNFGYQYGFAYKWLPSSTIEFQYSQSKLNFQGWSGDIFYRGYELNFGYLF